ncbi:MAG: hypothetical protein K2Y21_00560 [Phycisphaerales bacterium]|nr:hypothetical protein [Phycisphaerales bacterium]
MTTAHRSILLLSLVAGSLFGGCAGSEHGSRFSVGPNPKVETAPEPAGGFKIVQRYLTNGNQIVTAESLVLEPVVEPGTNPYQVLVGPARDGSPFNAQVRNSNATLLMDSGFAAAVGHQPIVVVKRVVAAAEGTTFVVEGSGRGVYVCVLNADPAKPVRVSFDGDERTPPVRVGNWQYVRIPDHATRIPAPQPIPFPGSSLTDPDDVGSLLKYSYAKRIQTGQAIQATDADAEYVRLLTH